MDRRTIINRILDECENRAYLEIGIASGACFLFINANYKVGVDPITPNEKIKDNLCDGCRYYQITSDKFFSEFRGIKSSSNVFNFDVVHINGFPSYAQTLKDTLSALKLINNNGFVIINDCIPNVGKDSTDIWRAIVHLRSIHDDINVFTLECGGGIAVVTMEHPENTLTYSQEDINNMTAQSLIDKKESILNIKPGRYLEEFLLHKRKNKKSDLGSHLLHIFGISIENN